MSTTGIRWRYLRLLLSESPDIAHLDALGDQGWELVCKNPAPGQLSVYEWLFKRMVLEHPQIVPTTPEEPASVRDAGLTHVDALVERTRKGWTDEARARARETRARNQQAAKDAQEEWEAKKSLQMAGTMAVQETQQEAPPGGTEPAS